VSGAQTPPIAPTAQVVSSRIWQEEAEPGDPFAARTARCHGYDVYDDMLGRAAWADMVFLLFRGEAPTREQARLLDALAVALADAGPRDAAVHAAMCGGAGGSTAASCLVAALAVGSGQQGGAREVMQAMRCWSRCGTDLEAWRGEFARVGGHVASLWPEASHPPGFNPHGIRVPGIVSAALRTLSALAADLPVASGGPRRLAWLQAHREALERAAGGPLSMAGVAAAALAELGFTPAEGEMLHLVLRLPGAAVHALEQAALGHRAFPFNRLELEEVQA